MAGKPVAASLCCGPTGVPGAGGPGRCVCRWAAARPRAVRAASFARRVASKPGQAPPPPTGTAADPSGALHTCGAWCADVCLCFVSKPGQAPPLPTGTAAGFSGPSGALHTCGAGALMCACASSRSPARPRYRPRAPQPGPMDPQCGLACRAGILGRSAACCYKRRQSEGFFAENQGFWTQIDDVCNMSTRKGGSNCSGLTTFVMSAAHWSPGQALPPPTII